MAFVNGDGTMIRCFNGVTGSSSGNCGFTVGRTLLTSGDYFVDFGFSIADRFYSVSVESTCCVNPIAVNFDRFSPTRIEVSTSETQTGNLTDRPFTIIVH
ncbi:hypothetical protein BH18ACI2_BH18ACI2_04860 [soil metagenome]